MMVSFGHPHPHHPLLTSSQVHILDGRILDALDLLLKGISGNPSPFAEVQVS
jgi:hypothetical protein